jgi:hypothetical protein
MVCEERRELDATLSLWRLPVTFPTQVNQANTSTMLSYMSVS